MGGVGEELEKEIWVLTEDNNHADTPITCEAGVGAGDTVKRPAPRMEAGGQRPAWDGSRPGGRTAAAPGTQGRGPSVQGVAADPASSSPAGGRCAPSRHSPWNLEACFPVRSDNLWHQNQRGAR